MPSRLILCALSLLAAGPAVAQKALPVPPVPPSAPSDPAPPPNAAPDIAPQPSAVPPPAPAPERAIGIALEGFDYPYSVRFREFVRAGQSVRMAYMDVAPAEEATGTVVLLHGHTLPSATWAPLPDSLRATKNRVVLPDQLGFWKSSKPADAVGLDEQARDTLALLDDLGIAKADFVGHGMGAMLAIRIARAAPDRVRRLVLADPIGLEDYRLSVPPVDTETLVAAERDRTTDAAMDAIRADAGPHFPPELLGQLRALRDGVRASGDYPRWLRASALQEQTLFQDPVAHEITLIDAPTLFVLGAGDHAAPGRDRAPERLRAAMGQNPALARTLADRMRAARVVVLPDTGHFALVESPEPFAQAITGFLGAP